MQTPDLLTALGYLDSPRFLIADKPHNWSSLGAAGFAHHFRRLEQQRALRGIYCLGEPEGGRSLLPLVCVVKVESDDQARLLHQQVWNRDFVPFLLVETPQHVRLYSGFEYAPAQGTDDTSERGLLEPVIRWNEIQRKLAGFHTQAIDDGEIWRTHGAKLDPAQRLDWHLLQSLQKLGQRLQQNGLCHLPTAHALIGKYIYFHYLKARGLLSKSRFDKWKLRESEVFGRTATLAGFSRLSEQLAEWPNGGIFPLNLDGKEAPQPQHVALVAGTFAGDDPETGQYHLDFSAYDFAHIPIETLSVVYEQFMHDEGTAKQKGAFYTPVPLIDFMVAELQATRPLRDGMRVLDPACGSGAFLVQCYRTLVEAKRQELGSLPSPVELRRLLIEHIYGVDSDGEACRVAGLSLSLALLDYIEDIPSEANLRRFKLPDLHNQNIFEADFFDPKSAFRTTMQDVRFDWVIGNPPWKELPVSDANKVTRADCAAFEWMRTNSTRCPTSGGKLAEAFAWHASEHAQPDGVIGLLLHAGSLFNLESQPFRAGFFAAHRVFCAVNFSNLRRRLFAGRMEEPAMAVFYAPPSQTNPSDEQPETLDVLCYSPLVANQEITRPQPSERRKDPFCLVVNTSEIRRVSVAEAGSGDFLPWKIALWGSHRDRRLLDKLKRRFPTFDDFAREHNWVRSQGPELRSADAPETLNGGTEYVAELLGKRLLDVKRLKNTERIFSLPAGALREAPLAKTECFVRKGRAAKTMAICRPPHVLLSRARTFAVFSNDYVVLPHPQIGIAGKASQTKLLKALTLLLNADFCQYHAFWLSPEWGIRTASATLNALTQLPLPLDRLDESGLSRWEQLHDALVLDIDREQGLRELNREVNDLLGLSQAERHLIHDLVHVRLELIESKVGEPATRQPNPSELAQYGQVLRDELDGFFGESGRGRHQIAVLAAEQAGLVEVRFRKPSKAPAPVELLQGSPQAAARLAELRDHLRRRHSQWLYFERDLRIYEGSGLRRRVILAKPLQRFHFTASQALLDADEIIADLIGVGEQGGTS